MIQEMERNRNIGPTRAIDALTRVPSDLFIEDWLVTYGDPEDGKHEFDLICRACGKRHVIREERLAKAIDTEFSDEPDGRKLICNDCCDTAWEWTRRA